MVLGRQLAAFPSFSVVFATPAREGKRHEFELFRLIADDVVHRLQQHGDPWDLSRELPPMTGKGYSTPPMDKG